MNNRALTITVFSFICGAFCSPASADGLSREQGDTMINELRQIRLLLEKQQRGGTAPPAPTAPEKVRLKIGREPALGRSDAPLVMVEYTDYQCTFCNRFYTTTFKELKKQYVDTGKMRFITRDLPLDFHPHAQRAAQATRCAGEQDKFWQVKDALMLNSSRLTPDLITSLVRDASLRMNDFQACMDSGKYLADIKESMASAKAIGINGTPSFVLGRVAGDYLEGYVIVGAQPYATFDAMAKDLLSAAEKK